MTVTSKVEVITPDKASKWLEKMAPNRRLREGKVIQHAETMERGEWKLTGEAVKFDENGVLIDGQHRLRAVELSGVSVEMLVVRGLDARAIVNIDTGLRRTLSDVLAMRGETNSMHLAATLVSTLQVRTAIQTGKWPHRAAGMYPTNDWCLQLLEQEPGIREAVKEAHTCANKHTGLRVHPKTWATSIHHLRAIDDDDADTFFTTLKKGANLSEDDVLFKFRRRFQAGNPEAPNTARDQFALMFKAWNHYRDGTTPHTLKVRFGGAKPEPFPVPK